ncbi:hypothetical protein CEUSTIGMA_g6622.t1 [Chlamydomonas eustigma]|uniref:Uncharacterized protein n=1 Tax=Chlamydomonas eustigma TaxID=1157962 RepID=A0A250X8G7_9CHLO|nr:hypothetical protein CEUSTIGMA_g6622.t1 [Chlamydomonas eustigma]|eukprot:GAX79182.1 hypothetical protein CEUSTIGMA_g6622.t1 [Chlamydomonas eustigma]
MADFFASLSSVREFMETRHNYIPVMSWESDVAKLASMQSVDYIRFALALLVSVPVGACVNMFKSATVRHLYAVATGFVLIYYPFGYGVIHAAPPMLVVYLAMLMVPSYCGVLAWLSCFPYLIYLHIASASGLNWQLGLLDFTGCQMVLTLKLITLAVARQDAWHAKRHGKELSPYQSLFAVNKTPNPLCFMSYVFGLGNLLAGPYLEYKDYNSFMQWQGTWDPKAEKKVPSAFRYTALCFVTAFSFLALHQLLVPTWNRNLVFTGWYKDSSFVVKAISCFLLSFTCQTKFVFAWKISEASLTLAGLNFNGWDDKTGAPLWGRYENVHFITMLLSDSARIVVSHWNIGTARFLRRYVYERLVPKGKKPGFPQLLATQVTSAIWHGLYPGYLLFFIGSAFWLNFATVIYKAEQALMPAGVGDTVPLKVLKIVWTHLVLNYLATSFMVLNFNESLEVYRSLHYLPWIIIVVGSFLFPLLLRGKSRRKERDDKKEH